MKYIILIFALTFTFLGNAQELTEKEVNKFAAAEEILRAYTDSFHIDSLSFEERVAKIHEFIPRFVAILKEKNSFYYPFDSLTTISVVVAPDDAFRIFTWQLKEPLGTYKYYGALQMNSEQLQLTPLFDYSDTMEIHPQTILDADNWYGGIYYNCLMQEHEGKKTYTLLGLDDVDFVSKRKFIEPIHFDEANKPVFGAPIIEFYDSLGNYTGSKSRFFIEYSDKATASLNFSKEHNMIIYDHVVPPTEEQNGAWFTYVPDGTYEGFRFEKGKWVWVEKIFHFSIGEPDNPPVPVPLNNQPKKNIIGD